jgi:hypothetical protein
MNSADLLAGGFKLIGLLGPFALVFLAVSCAGELIDLLKKAASIRNRRGGY